MNLLFSTSNQAGMFLAVVPLGFLLALCFDIHALYGRARPVMDVICFLLCGLGVLALLLLKRDGGLRLYHLLAMLSGACLYVSGIGRAARLIAERIRRKKVNGTAGITKSSANQESMPSDNH